MTPFPPAFPHGPIVEVFPNVFTVSGSARFAPLISITRNMTIVREGSALTLISAVRLSPEGEAELSRLGEVKHLVKIGFFHGMDDPYYMDRYHPTLWAPPGAKHRGELTTDRELRPGDALPLSDGSLFAFENGTKPETAIVLEREGGILLSCDSVQNWVNFEGCSRLGGLMMRAMGFLGPAKIGPGWRSAAERKKGPTFEGDFERLLQLRWKHLLSAHGVPLRDTAHADLRRMVAATYGKKKGH
jgi:hypothetical protein